MNRKRILAVPAVGLAVLAVLGLASFWPHVPLDSALSSPDAPPTSLVCYGSVDTRHGALQLQPVRAGRVVRVLAKERQSVRKDAPLLQLDDSPARLQEQEAALAVEAAEVQLTRAKNGVTQYQAKRAQADAALEAAAVKLHRAEVVLNDAEGAIKKGFITAGHVDQVRDQLAEAKALVKAKQNKVAELKAVNPELDVRLAQLQLERGRVQLRQARQEIDEHVLKAPADGTVLRVQAQEGELVGPTSPRPAVLLAPAGAWVVRAEVSQEFAARVREGLDVQVEDEASTTLLARGRIAEVSDWFLPRRQFHALPTGVNTGLTLECVIDLQERHGQLRLGQRVRVRVLTRTAASGELGPGSGLPDGTGGKAAKTAKAATFCVIPPAARPPGRPSPADRSAPADVAHAGIGTMAVTTLPPRFCPAVLSHDPVLRPHHPSLMDAAPKVAHGLTAGDVMNREHVVVPQQLLVREAALRG